MTAGWTARAAGTIIAAGGLALLAGLSGWRYRAHPSGTALLRVAFSARPQQLERCREVSAEELARRPVHMRQRIECVGHSASYRLDLRVDGAEVSAQTLRGGGVRHDRPVSVLIEQPITPGPHALLLEVTRVESADSEETRPVDSTRRARQSPLPASLQLAASPTFVAGRVVLVTYDVEQRQLVLRTHSAPSTK
jgi:hypothetical protein